MGLPKGRTNNPNGRKVGSKTKKTLQWEMLGEMIIGKYTERVCKYFDTIEDDKEFYQAYLNLLEYFKPRLNRTNLAAEPGDLNLNLTPLEFFSNGNGEKSKDT